MMSTRKRNANRENARASTGPRTAQGKMRSANNARRHGLNTPSSSDPMLSGAIEELTQQIAGQTANANRRELARQIAEAQIDVLLARRARHDILASELARDRYQPLRGLMKRIKGRGRVADFVMRGQPIPERLLIYIAPPPEGAQKFASILCDLIIQHSAFERYERRALSRRKAAIRAFDAECW